VPEWTGVREGEGARLGRLCLFIFLTTAGVVLAKSAQRGIFLAAYPRSAIPDAFLLSSLTLAAASLGASAVAGRLGLVRLLKLLLLGGAGLLVFAWAAVRYGRPWAPMATYAIVEGLSSLLLVQSWSVVSEALDVRSAKRLLPLVSIGAGLAWTGGGLAVPALADAVGASALLAAVPVLYLAAWAALREIGKRDVAAASQRPTGPSKGLFADAADGLKYIFSEPLMRVLAAVITLDLLVEQVTDFQLFSLAQEVFASEPARIAGFMGVFYGVTGALSLAAPFALSGRVLARLGSTRSVAVAALWMFVLSLTFLAVPTFAVMVLLAAGDRVLKQSLSAPARTQILGAIPAVRRAQAGALLRGIVASGFALVGAGVLKAVQRQVPVRAFSFGTAALALVLLWAILSYLRKGYLLALERTVDRRKLDLDAPGESHLRQLDQEQVALLSEALKSDDVERALFSISILSQGDPKAMRPVLAAALRHRSDAVVAGAVEALAGFGDAAEAAPLKDLLVRTASDEVRCACVRGLAFVGGADALPVLEAQFGSTSPRVRALASAAAVKLDAASAAGASALKGLQRMLGSVDEVERAAAAWALGQVALDHPALRGPFEPLLNDASLAVRKQALGSAGWFSDLTIIHDLVFALAEHGVGPTAFEAFAQLKDEALANVEAVIRDAPAGVVSRTAAALGQGGGRGSVRVLGELLGHADGGVRHRAARSLMVRRRANASWRPEGDVLVRAIRAELEQGYRYHAALIALDAQAEAARPSAEGTRFLQGELRSRIQQTEERLLSLIAVLSDRRVAYLASQLRGADPHTVARVVELLEQSIDAELAGWIVPFIEHQPAQARAKVAAEQFHVPAEHLLDPVLGIIALKDDHLRRCALLAWRERMAAEYPALADAERHMLHLVERIRFLRSVPLFKELTPEDLMKLAEIAEPAEYLATHRIFKKGDPGDVLCVVVNGRVEIKDGTHLIASLGPHEFFGELAVLDHEPRSADAVCAEDTELLQIGGPDLEELMERRPEIPREVIRVLARRLRKTTQAMISSPGR